MKSVESVEGALTIVTFCAEEVERQGRGPLEVVGLYRAWLDAIVRMSEVGLFTLADVIRWGHMIEPEALNKPNGWRAVNVQVGDRICPHVNEVQDRMDRWHSQLKQMTPAEAYREFEEVHPFADGNGRAGKVIFNWLMNTMGTPVMPPNFWGITNP